jgi:hypothetical protein
VTDEQIIYAISHGDEMKVKAITPARLSRIETKLLTLMALYIDGDCLDSSIGRGQIETLWRFAHPALRTELTKYCETMAKAGSKLCQHAVKYMADHPKPSPVELLLMLAAASTNAPE